jgi:TPR repeat protein
VRYLEEAKSLGFPQAFFNLGCVYENGLLENKNLNEALMHYYKAGVKGDIQSRLKFAYQLMNQTSVVKDEYEDHYRMAHRWLDDIIHQIDLIENGGPGFTMLKTKYTTVQKAEALLYLGLMYEYGLGVVKNPRQSFNYYIDSSNFGYAAAKNKVGDCYFSGYGVKEDRKIAIGCYM